MALGLADVARRLRELIAALDRRTPRVEDAAESGIARDSAVLRARAVARLTEISVQTTSLPDHDPDQVQDAGR